MLVSARGLGRAEVGVVDAGDRDLVGDPHALLAARDHAADREDVVGRDHRGRPLLQREQALHHRGRRGEVDRPVLSAALVELEAGLGQRGPHPGAALERAVIALGDGAQQAETAMAERDQVPGHLEGRSAVVEADARVAPQRVDAPGQHVGPAVALEQGEEGRVVVQADEHERVDAVADQLLGDPHLGLEVVVVLGQHQGIALRVEHRLHRARGARIERVVERRHDRADHLAAVPAQRARRAVWDVAQLGDRLAHQVLRARVDLVGRVEDARHGRRRDPGEAGDVLRAATPIGPRRSGIDRSEDGARHAAILARRSGGIDFIARPRATGEIPGTRGERAPASADKVDVIEYKPEP